MFAPEFVKGNGAPLRYVLENFLEVSLSFTEESTVYPRLE